MRQIERQSARRLVLFLLTVVLVVDMARSATPGPTTMAETGPLVLGHGVGRFKVGRLLARDDFENLENWVVQIQDRSGFAPPNVEARDHSLDCLLPGRGCTVWFKKKLKTRVTITYEVLCPTPTPAIKGVQPRDINNFWMATDPVDPDQGLFDSARYTGAFGSYDKMRGYYASTGGGGAGKANLTTRMRRYPREVNGKPAAHLALNDKDGKREYLITAGKVMSVQLVAYDDVIQYIVNGRLNYDMAQAVWKVQNTRSPAQLDTFLGKLRIHQIATQDGTIGWLRSSFPRLFIIYSHKTYQGMFGGRDPLSNLAWVNENIRNDHGPLCAVYPHEGMGCTGVCEGDLPSFLWLVSANRGLNDPDDPTQPSWGDNSRRMARRITMLMDPVGQASPGGVVITRRSSRNGLTGV